MKDQQRSFRDDAQAQRTQAARPVRAAVLASAIAATLASCATYTAQPLSSRSDLAERLPITLPARPLDVPEPRKHPFDPSDGLDMTEIATLAVINDPKLRVARRKAELAHAQLFAASLLPDPQVSMSADHPTSSPDHTNAYSFELSYELTALITRGAAVDSARAAAAQVNFELV